MGAMAPLRGAAIVCPHVAEGSQRILYAERSAPVDEADSGWQFICGSGTHDDERSAEVWALDEVVDLDPTVVCLLDAPIGTRFSRKSTKVPWEKSTLQ